MSDRRLLEVERELRRWTRRPPKLTPRIARTRVLARLDEAPSRRGWRLAGAAALAAGVLAGLVILGPRLSGERPAATPAAEQAAQASEGMLVYQLQSGAKLYFTLASPAPPASHTVNDGGLQGEG